MGAALQEGEKDEDKLVATIMGAEDADAMTDLQQQYKDKIKAQIAKVREVMKTLCLLWPFFG